MRAKKQTPKSDPPDNSDMRILLIDDDNWIAKVIHVDAHAVAPGIGLNLADAEPFDVIFVDVYYEGTSVTGLDILPALTKLAPAAILVSSYLSPEICALGISLGAFAVLEKGDEKQLGVLLGVVRAWLLTAPH